MNISKTKKYEFIPLLIRDMELMNVAKTHFHAGCPDLLPAADALHAEAEAAMTKAPLTIVYKQQVPPGGDKRDYMSTGPYWWPDPDKEDGRPYIRRDGETNPECRDSDRPVLLEMVETVETLALAGWFYDTSRFSRRAVELLKVFFLNSDTRMNPHLEFGQAIPGKCEGRGIGIIETTPLARNLIDAIGLLRISKALETEEFSGLLSWFDSYLEWLRNSSHGIDESEKENNHGTAYDLQAAVFALFTEKEEVAREVLEMVPERRIFSQIEPDGRQPREMIRTLALHYSTMNLSLYFDLAAVAENLGIDLWNTASNDGRGMRRALDWLFPYWTGECHWPYEQIIEFNKYDKVYELLRRAALKYETIEYENNIGQLPVENGYLQRLRSNLYWPG